MKSKRIALVALLLAAPFSSYAAEQLIPAGSLIQCTVAEPRINSKTTAVGDPVLCRISHAERYGRSVLPYDSYLVGQFQDYKDPGHFVGKGWMELSFDRMIIEPDTVIPIEARVVDVPGYNIDIHGRILGKGHAVRDTVEWMIPVLWPIDLLELPRRGPRPTLKEETRLTLKVMDDLAVPITQPPPQEPSGLVRRAPSDYQAPPPPPAPEEPIAEEAPPAPEPVPMVAMYVPVPLMLPPPMYFYPAPEVMTAWGPAPAAPMMAAWSQRRTVTLYRNGYLYQVPVP